MEVTSGGTGERTTFGRKVRKQLTPRGWTVEAIRELIAHPCRTAPIRDTRHLPGGGRHDAPATAYIAEDGNYVVRNDETGDVVQVSNRYDPNWKAPF